MKITSTPLSLLRLIPRFADYLKQQEPYRLRPSSPQIHHVRQRHLVVEVDRHDKDEAAGQDGAPWL